MTNIVNNNICSELLKVNKHKPSQKLPLKPFMCNNIMFILQTNKNRMFTQIVPMSLLWQLF